MDSFLTTTIMPQAERRANDSLMVLLMQQIHQKVEDMDKKLSQHMSEETLLLAEEIAKLINKAFPGEDPLGHRTYHETQMQAAADRAAFWKAMRIEISKWGIIGLLGWLVYAAWISFLKGPR